MFNILFVIVDAIVVQIADQIEIQNIFTGRENTLVENQHPLALRQLNMPTPLLLGLFPQVNNLVKSSIIFEKIQPFMPRQEKETPTILTIINIK